MKVIDKTPSSTQKSGQFEGMLGSLQQALGMSGATDQQAEEALINQMKMLPNPFTLLRNVRLPGQADQVPLVLVGPTGIYVMLAHIAKGVYRAKDDDWMEMKGDNRQFVPAKPNPLSRAVLLTRAVENFITQQGYEIPEAQPVVYFSNPGTHVDAVRPAARIVLSDGLDRFVSSLQQAAPSFSDDDVVTLVKMFDLPEPAQPEVLITPPPFTEEPADEKVEKPKPAPRPQSEYAKRASKLVDKAPFSTQQWIILGVIAGVLILALILIIFYALIYIY